MRRQYLFSILTTTVLGLFLVSSCKKVTTPPDTKYISDFHNLNYIQSVDLLEEDNLCLYVDYSKCIAIAQHSAFFKKLVPSFVDATKNYYSIKGDTIKKEVPADTYNRLSNIKEVNFADLKTAAEQMAGGKSEGVLLTDGEYYNPTLGGSPHNPYLAKAFKTWLKRGHDIFIISEPYVEQYDGADYNKKRFYFLFTDTRLNNNIYNRIIETGQLESFPEVQMFHLSADHPNLAANNGSFTANPTLAAEIEPHGNYEIQDWTVDWKVINDYIMAATDTITGQPLPNGDYVIKDLKVYKNSFGGYKIKKVGVMVYDLNVAYQDFYLTKDNGGKVGPIGSSLPKCPNFLLIDDNEFTRHGFVNLYFDITRFDNSFLKYGCPYNFFKIDLLITETENVFANYSSMFLFDLLGKPGEQNLSVVSSVEQCLADKDLQNQMKHSPIYTVYVKSNKY